MNTTIRTKKKLVHVNNGAMLSSTQVPLDTLFLWEFNFVNVILETMQFLGFVQSAGFFPSYSYQLHYKIYSLLESTYSV